MADDKILIQIQRLGPDFSDYAHCEYINIKIQIHKCRFTNTKTEYKNTQIQIGKFKDKNTNTQIKIKLVIQIQISALISVITPTVQQQIPAKCFQSFINDAPKIEIFGSFIQKSK